MRACPLNLPYALKLALSALALAAAAASTDAALLLGLDYAW